MKVKNLKNKQEELDNGALPSFNKKKLVLKDFQGQLNEILEKVANHPMNHLLHSGTCKSCQIPYSSRRIKLLLKDCGHEICGSCFLRNTLCAQCGVRFSIQNLDIERDAPERALRMYKELQEKKEARLQKRHEDELEWKRRKHKILEKQMELREEVKTKLRRRALELEDEKEQKLRELIARERKKMEEEHEIRQLRKKQLREERRKHDREAKIQKQKAHFKHQELEKYTEQFLIQQREKISELDLTRVTVAIRMIPLRDSLNPSRSVKQINETTLQVRRTIPRHYAEGKRTIIDEFQFNHIWSGSLPYESTVHKNIGSKVVNAAINGVNSTVISFGQSSTGKTFLMFGPQMSLFNGGADEQVGEGLIPAIGKELINSLLSLYPERWEMQISIIEIYHEQTRDLLSNHEEYISNSIYETNTGQVQVKGVRKYNVKTFEGFMQFLKRAMSRRQTRTTQLNGISFRSHVILSIYLSYASLEQSSSYIVQTETNLVDLAGFERVGKSLKHSKQINGINSPSGLKSKEGQVYDDSDFCDGASINKSLLELGICLQKLAEMRKQPTMYHLLLPKKVMNSESPYIPTRSSTLTWLLKNSLIGKAKVFMIGTISPSKQHTTETLETLYYASQAMGIESKEESKKTSVKPIEVWKSIIRVIFEKIVKKYTRFCNLRLIYNRKDGKYKKIVSKIKDLVAKGVSLLKSKVLELGKETVSKFLETEFAYHMSMLSKSDFTALITLISSQFPRNYWRFIDSDILDSLRLQSDVDLYEWNRFHDVSKVNEKELAMEMIPESESPVFDFRKI